MIKTHLKRLLDNTIAVAGRHRWQHSHGSLLILTYHRILPPSDLRYQFEQPGMVVHPDTFEMHLETLSEYFEIVSLPEWVDNARAGRVLPDKACAITFDDGWRDNYQFAYPLLLSSASPACIFLVAGFIGKQQDFWPGQLARLLAIACTESAALDSDEPAIVWLSNLMGHAADKPEFNRDFIDRCIIAAKEYPDNEIYPLLASIRQWPPFRSVHDERVLLNHEEISSMGHSGLITYGSHSCHHTRLSDRLTKEILNTEIVKSRELLQDITRQEINLFCYPNGDISKSALPMIQSNYQGACTTQRGWNRADGDLWQLKRISIHEDAARTRKQFLARLSGWY